MNLSDYVQDVSKRFAAGNAREHTYRGTLQTHRIMQEIDTIKFLPEAENV